MGHPCTGDVNAMGKPEMQDVSHFMNIWSTISIQVLNPHDVFIDVDGDFQKYFGHEWGFYVGV